MEYLGWAIATLCSALLLFLAIGIGIFVLLKKYGKSLFGEVEYLDIAFAGAILIALSQLFGPLVATTYPVVFGQDASDYRLEFENTYIMPSSNSSSDNLIAAENAYGYVKVPFQNNTLDNKITAFSKNKFIKYNKKIFLEIIVADNPDGIDVSLTRPVIEINQSSNLTIKFKDNPSPKLYRIKVRGTDEDGTIREAMMVIGIPENPGEDVIYFTPDFEKAVEGSGYFITYRYVNLNGSAHEQAYLRNYEQGSATIDNQYAF